MTRAATAALVYLAGYPAGVSAAMIGDRLHVQGLVKCMGRPSNLSLAGGSVLRALAARQLVVRYSYTTGAVWCLTEAGREWARKNGHVVVVNR